MKIFYTPTIIQGAYKSFYNYIKFMNYDIDLKPLDFLNIPDFLECLEDYENHNRVVSSLSVFCVLSFVKNNFSVDKFQDDYNVVKSDLPYKIDFVKLRQKLLIIDSIIAKVDTEWIFIRSFDDLEFFQIYFAYKLKQKGVKVVFGKEQEFKQQFIDIFLMDEISDKVFVGHGENFLDSFCNGRMEDKYETNSLYKDEFLESFNNEMSDLEIKNKIYNFSYHTLCPYKCVFCTQNKGNNLKLNYDRFDEMIDKFVYINKNFDVDNNFCISSLPFYSNDEIQYFFGKIYDIFQDRIKFNIVHLTTPQYLDNAELLTKFKDSLFYVGVEHFSDKILTLMKKPTTKEMNLKLLINKKYSNAGFGLIYNFFKEDLKDFNEMINAIKIARSYQPNRFFKLNSFQYTIPADIKEPSECYDLEFIEPKILKAHFNLDQDFFIKYVNKHDPHEAVLKEKNNIAKRNHIGVS